MAQRASSRGTCTTAHLHEEFSQLPLKHRWVRREGHWANICRGDRRVQVGLDSQVHGLHGLGQQLYDGPATRSERS